MSLKWRVWTVLSISREILVFCEAVLGIFEAFWSCGKKYVIKCDVKIAKNERKNEFLEKQEGNFGLK